MSADTPAPFGTYAPSLWVRTLLAASQNTVLGRGQARRWITGLVRKAHSGPLDTRLWGQDVRVHIGPNNNEVKALLSPKSFNRAELDAVRAHLPPEGGVFVDIGANVGMMSLAVTAGMQAGTVIAIEPQPDMFARLSFSMAQAKDHGVRHVLVNAAIGPEVGTAALAVPDQPGMASLAAGTTAEITVNVPVIPLADVFQDAGIDHVDVLKIDVEGYEDQALLPLFERAEAALWPRLIVMEHCHSHRWQSDAISTIQERGYREVRRDRQNICLLREAK